jgi:hypothetical protein
VEVVGEEAPVAVDRGLVLDHVFRTVVDVTLTRRVRQLERPSGRSIRDGRVAVWRGLGMRKS